MQRHQECTLGVLGRCRQRWLDPLHQEFRTELVEIKQHPRDGTAPGIETVRRQIVRERRYSALGCAKNAAVLFVACESNPDTTGRLSIPHVMRLRGYFEDEAVNCTLQMQVRREAKKLKGIASPSAAAVLSAVAAMVALSTTVTTRALATILPEDNDGSPVLSLLSPPKKTRYMSHQRQVNRQNKQKAKEAYAQALASAMMLIAAERGKEKENTCPPLSISNRF